MNLVSLLSSSVPPAISPVSTAVALLTIVVVVALVAWALSLMQAANDRQEFSLMLAGCMVCSAAVGLTTVMVLTFASPNRLLAVGLGQGLPDPDGLFSPDQLDVSWGSPLECLVEPGRCAALPSS
jgi:hypothetical protein